MVVFFFKQKTAYEMRISDWSSDVCSSDLGTGYRTVEQNNMPIPVPLAGVPVTAAVTTALCVQTLIPSYGCQHEKPIFLPSETDPVPFQIFRIGNLAVLGVPFEVTTMSGRRLRKTVLDALSPVGDRKSTRLNSSH